MRNRALALGLLVVAAVVILTAALMQLRGPHGSVIYADLGAAAGLRDGAAVSFRGIEVGRVTHIAFVPNGLRVTIRLTRTDVPLRSGDGVRATSNGVFGDIGLELVPGSGQSPALADGGVLAEVAQDPATLRRRAAGEAFVRSLTRALTQDSTHDLVGRARVKP